MKFRHANALLRVLRLAALAALGAGCAAVPASAPPPVLPLLSPAALDASHSVEQILHAAYGAGDATLQCIVEVTPQRLRVIGLSALGQRVFTLEQDADGVQAAASAYAPAFIQPQNIVADMQLAYWPLAALQAAAPDGVRVSEPRSGLRRLERNDRLIAEVHFADADPWNGRLWLVNFEHGYSLDIRSQPLTAVAR